jgi:predicted Zn-dependent protease
VDVAKGDDAIVLDTLQKAGTVLAPSDFALFRSQAMRHRGDVAGALAQLRVAADAAPDNSELRVELAVSLAALGRVARAVQGLDEYLARNPRDANALRARGELRLATGRTEDGVKDLELAMIVAPASWPIRNRLSTQLSIADAELGAGRPDRAKAILKQVQQQAPGLIGAKLLAARIALLDGRAEEAVDLLQPLAELAPQNDILQHTLAEAWVRTGNTARATVLLEQWLKSHPVDSGARLALAKIMMQQNRPGRVIELLEGPASSGPPGAVPADPATEQLLSAARLAQQQAESTTAALAQQLVKDPQNPALNARLAEAYLLNGDPERALAAARVASTGERLSASVAVELAALLALGNDIESNRLVTSLLGSAATSVETLLAASDAAQRAGRQDIVGRLLDRAEQRGPANDALLMRRANQRLSERNYAQARVILEKLSAAKPRDPQVLLALAHASEAAGNVEGTRSALQLAVAASPAVPEASLMLANLELRAANPAAAAQVLDALIAAAPKDGATASAAGRLLEFAGRFDEARSRYKQAAEQNDGVAAYWFDLGRVQIRLGDRAGARESFAASVARRPDWLPANVAAIRLSIELHDLDRARSLAAAFAGRNPQHAGAWMLVGEAGAAARRWDDAKAAFVRSFDLRPSGAAAVGEHLVLVSSRALHAEQPLLDWLARQPNDLAARMRLADFYIGSGDREHAIPQLEQILGRQPNDFAALNNLAWMLSESSSARAELLARKAYAIAPEDPSVADTLGWALFNNNKLDEARRFMTQAAAALPNDRSVQYRRAKILARMGDAAAARAALEKAVSGDADFPERAAALALAKELQ